MSKTIGERLAELRSRSRLPLSEIARLAGYAGPSSIQRYFSPEYDPSVLDYRFALKLVEAMKGAGDPPIDPYEIMALTDRGALAVAGTPVARRPALETKAFIEIFATSPIYSEYVHTTRTGQKGHAIVIDRSYPVTTLEAPMFLYHRDVYGFYQSGQSMSPRLEDGEIAFTEGRRKPALGDDVVAVVEERRDDEEAVAFVGRLTLSGAEAIQIRQYNGDVIDIALEDVSSLRRIMKAIDLLV